MLIMLAVRNGIFVPIVSFFLVLFPVVAATAAAKNDPTSARERELINRGRDLFLNETFNGNGRTCATCHRPENNHTIDPIFIAKLPASDPLFVAEQNPQLKELDNTGLLRQFALVAVNADGFDNPAVFRSVPHLLGLVTSIATEAVDFPQDAKFANALGNSGDGAPGDGSLRQFVNGAITQHLTRSMQRIPGNDFRLATDEELDALVAYMLSLGRQEDLVLAELNFSHPLVQKGKELFDSKAPGTGQCKGCHNNAGANSSTTLRNGSRDTGVENFRLQPARLADPTIPYDGGFGTGERNGCGVEHNNICYGDGRFNMTSLVEAADTPPYFHNNSVTTLEEAIASYNSPAFNSSPGSINADGTPRKINLDSTEVVAIAVFLRSINVLENIRSANQFDQEASALDLTEGLEKVKLGLADSEDAIEVLGGGVYNVYPASLQLLKYAYALERKALTASDTQERNRYLEKATEKRNQAKTLILR